MREDFRNMEEVYKIATGELEASMTANRFLKEFNQLWNAVIKRQEFISSLSNVIKEQQTAILNLSNELTTALKATEIDQETIEKLKEKIGNSLRLVDATHAREQVAQETLENLRQQVTQLNTEMELKAKMELDQDGEFASMAKNKELQAKEKGKMEIELSRVKEKLRTLTKEYEELDKKYTAATLKMTELSQDLENKTHEVTKETQLKGRFEEEIINIKRTLEDKNNDVMYLNNQIMELTKKNNKLENSLRTAKNDKERLQQNYDVLSQRYMKLQEEYSFEARQFETISQKVTQLGNQLKKKDEELINDKKESVKLRKLIESSSKKFDNIELLKEKLQKEKNKLSLQVKIYEREINNLKNTIENEKQIFQNLNRTKENELKHIYRLEKNIQELNKKLITSEQIRVKQQDNINLHEAEVKKYKQVISEIEKEKEQKNEEINELKNKIEEIKEEIKITLLEITSLKREKLGVDENYKKQQNVFDIVITERNSFKKELLEAKDEIIDFKQKFKVMMQQVEQLKEDISCKENELTSRELMHRKLQSEKQSLKADSQLWKENYKKAKKVIDTLQEEISEIKYTLNMNNSKVQRFRKEIDHVMNERDILNSQLNHCKNDLALLNEKLRVLQVTLDKGKALYFQHLDDIHLLKIEVKQLRSEKLKLAKVVNNSTDFRSEIFHLERDLTKERLKCKALEEELQTPLNIHRWRKLEGSDPVKLELLQKIKILQKRLLKGTTSSKKLENKLLNCNKKYEALKKELSRQPGPDIIQQLTKTQSALRENSTNKRCLLGQIAAYKSEIADLNLSIQHVKNELTEVKKLYFEQKSKAERYKRHLDELKKERMNHENEELTTILPLLKAKISNGYDRLNSNNGADSNTSKVNNDICNAITRQSF